MNKWECFETSEIIILEQATAQWLRDNFKKSGDDYYDSLLLIGYDLLQSLDDELYDRTGSND